MSHFISDQFFFLIIRAVALVVALIVGFILFFLLLKSLPFFQNYSISDIFFNDGWSPVDGFFNMFPMFVGSLLIMVGGLAFAMPLGIGIAVFSNLYSPPQIQFGLRTLTQLLAGIPSVVFGFWGLVELAPQIRRIDGPGVSLLTGIVVVGLMILPTVTLILDIRLSSIPKGYFGAARSLGLSRWTTFSKAIFPEVASSMGVAACLAGGRAIGETMAVVMVCGNIVQIPAHIFEPIRPLTANIALEMAYAMGDHQSALFVAGLLLALLVVGLIFMADQWMGRTRDV